MSVQFTTTNAAIELSEEQLEVITGGTYKEHKDESREKEGKKYNHHYPHYTHSPHYSK